MLRVARSGPEHRGIRMASSRRGESGRRVNPSLTRDGAYCVSDTEFAKNTFMAQSSPSQSGARHAIA